MDYSSLLSKYAYAELRIEHSFDSAINLKDDEVRHVSGSSHGVSVRVLEKGSWGFASGSDISKIPELISHAQRLAGLAQGKLAIPERKAINKTIIEKLELVDSETKVKSLVDAANDAKGGKVTSRLLSCSDSIVKKEFYDSLGTSILQETGYTYLSCSCIAKDGSIQRGGERAWSRSGFGKLNVLTTMREAREKALRLLDSVAPPKGRFTVVMDPEMTGVLSHEALGHACEADSVIDRESMLADKVGQKIGNELVTITDDPTAKDFGNYAYDDEGEEGRPTVLLEKGILKNYINSMETAYALGHKPNGHARAGSCNEVPIVRMSNTYFKPGASNIEDVFDLDHGVYLKGMKGGSVDIFSGGFMFKAEEAYEIIKGEKGKLMRDVTITGNIMHTLMDVECVGDDFNTSPGMCGKFGQSVPVSDGGPHIRIRNVAIG